MKKLVKFSGIALSALLLSSCMTYRNSYVKAENEFAVGHYMHAYDRLERLARHGDTRAQYAVGYMNYYGIGISKDRDLARSWFKRSAKKGYVPSQQALHILTADAYNNPPPIKMHEYQEEEFDEQAKAPITETSQHALTDLDWMRAQPPQGYTVRLGTSKSKKDLAKIRKAVKETNHLASYRFKKNKQFYYALVMGSFLNAKEATAARKHITEKGIEQASKVLAWADIQQKMLP